jgi:hypothetical protein
MQATYLVAPEISSYVNTICSLIDEKNNTQLNEKEIKNDKKEIQKTDLLRYKTTIGYLHAFNADVQSVILAKIQSVKTWVKAKIYCSDEAINLYVSQKLIEAGKNFYLGNATKILLSQQFWKLIEKCEDYEIEQLLTEHRKEADFVWQSSSHIQRGIGLIGRIIAFSLDYLGILAGLYVGFRTYRFIGKGIDAHKVEILHRSTAIFINVLPAKLFSLAFKIYDLRYSRFIFSLILRFTPLYRSNYVKTVADIFCRAIYFSRTLSTKLFEVKIKLAYNAYKLIRYGSYQTSQSVSKQASWLENRRRDWELRYAEKLWVDQVMNLKARRIGD